MERFGFCYVADCEAYIDEAMRSIASLGSICRTSRLRLSRTLTYSGRTHVSLIGFSFSRLAADPFSRPIHGTHHMSMSSFWTPIH